MPTTAPGLAEETVPLEEQAVTAEFIEFLKAASLRRHPTGPIRRFNQGRAAGCVEAEFSIREDLPSSLKVGLFAESRTYRSLIRFANASSSTDREKDVRGMAIAVFDVPGTNLTAGETRQDFILNSYPVMLAANTKEFKELLEANEAGGLRRVLYFASHPRAARVAFRSRQHHTSHLDIRYWSTTPYLFGPGRAVKYVVRPASTRTSSMPSELTDTYLSDALRARLADGEALFDFMVQFQTDSTRMPIEDATVEWNEEESPYVAVARIRIPTQRVGTELGAPICEAMSFNPWHCLEAHRPLGSMNRARKAIYRALSELRQQRTVSAAG